MSGQRQRVLVPTGISVNMGDAGVVGLVAAHSGLALKHGIQVHPGVIDSDYIGEIGVVLFNLDQTTFTIHHGDRIAQLLFQPVIQVNFKKVGAFSAVTERGAAGFGSTGTA